MSIPKEPRQLMINLMYLVLTALLALNVSAEVMNAFFSLDKGMKSSRQIVEKSNDAMQAAIEKGAKDYPSPQAEEYKNRAIEANKITADFVSYIDGIRKDLFEKAGGANPKIPDQPKDIRNKDITTKMFVNDGLGSQIEAKVKETRDQLIKLADNDAAAVAGISLDVEELPSNTKAKNWSEFKFKQMPVSAVFPLLGKIQSDAKSSASSVLTYCSSKVTGTDIKFDKFIPGVAPEKNYVILGEEFKADVFLSAFSSKLDNISINVDGRNLPLKDGIGSFSEKPSSVGEKKYTVSINIRNPATGQTETVKKEFSYEVGQRSAAVQLDKMNVFYIGVDNPISVSVAGVSSNDIKISASGVNVAKGGGAGKYVVTATTPTNDASITISGGGVTQKFPYRVKRIPDPNPRLGGNAKNKGGTMGNGEFKAQGGVSAMLENFDFDATCAVVGFEVTYLAKRQDPITRVNSGAKWSGDVGELIQRAKPGDAFFFDEVKCKCPGDVAARNIGSISYKIK
ncbi:MAG TPA: gliding motility protein GldM [Saprospiraceae bacterium]|nr:gliding motility protein GldM [Saprospiraceae bacterium]